VLEHIHDPVPDAGLPPTDKAIIASGAGGHSIPAGRARERQPVPRERVRSVLARTEPPAMSDLDLLSGVERKLDFGT
jgi:hypothetical protein